MTVTPGTATLTALEAAIQLTAQVQDQYGEAMSGVTVEWATSAAHVASVDAAGLVAAAANGTVTITATADTASGTAQVTVEQMVSAVSVSPAADTLVHGDTLRFTAQGTDANGHSVAGIEFSWASSDTAVATVDARGLATGVHPGYAEIAATSAGLTARADLVVESRRPSSVSVTPDSAVLVALTDTTRLNAAVHDQLGEVMPGVEVAWASADTTVAAVDSAGLVTAVSDGTAAIMATADTVTGTAQVAVDRVVSAVSVSPATDTISKAHTIKLAAQALDANGYSIAGVEFRWSSSNDSVAVADNSGLVTGRAEGVVTITATSSGVEGHSEITVVHPDRSALEALYHATDGPNWLRRDNWLTDAPLREWYRIRLLNDRVQWLHLNSNGLSGPIPPDLGSLAKLTELRLYGNAMTGPIPPELANLVELEELALFDNKLRGEIPPALGKLASLKFLSLFGNELTGPIPPELGNLANLQAMLLPANNLSGSIPSNLGNLSELETLWLQYNDLTGVIPPELGKLVKLIRLALDNNDLSGAIPPALGSLSNVRGLYLYNNRLGGPIPPELGRLEHLSSLWIQDNDLTGPVPTELGALPNLRDLNLRNNPRLSGSLPRSFTSLTALRLLYTDFTDLCAPADSTFQAWLNGVPDRRIQTCGADDVRAYLTQAVQSRRFPVWLVAGRDALLRVFVTAAQETSEGIPDVIARFYRDSKETYKITIPGKSTPIPTEVDESSLSKSANAVIPDSIVQPGLEIVIEIDPDGTLDDSLGVQKRIPDTGRLSAGVRAVENFDLTIVPFLYEEDPDSSIIELVDDMADDPEGHDLLYPTRRLLPIDGFEVDAHAPVVTSTNDSYKLLEATTALHEMEDAEGHYMGTIAGGFTGPGGVALLGGNVSFAIPGAYIMAHELGHNVGLLHAPCGNPGFEDPNFPQKDGAIGAWGYDNRADTLVSPEARDLMSLCSSPWISEYNFSKMIRIRAASERRRGTSAPPRRSLLLWGGVNGDGVPLLEPAVVVTVPSAGVGEHGDYQLTARTASGDELFSFRFAMEEVADGDGRKLFALTIPAQPHWAGNLATITLSGPEGEAALDAEGDRSVVIWRDPRTGQVRGFLRDLSPEAVVRTRAALLARDPGLEVFVSRGIPDADAWRR